MSHIVELTYLKVLSFEGGAVPHVRVAFTGQNGRVRAAEGGGSEASDRERGPVRVDRLPPGLDDEFNREWW